LEQPEDCIQDWFGNVLSIRTTELDVGNACLRIQSELISEQLPAFAQATWDKWYVTVNLSMTRGAASSGNTGATGNNAPVLPVQPANPSPNPPPTFDHRYRDRLLTSFDSSDSSDLDEPVGQPFFPRRFLPAEHDVVGGFPVAAGPSQALISSDDDEDDTIRPRRVFFRDLPVRARRYLEGEETVISPPPPRCMAPGPTGFSRRPDSPVFQSMSQASLRGIRELLRPPPPMPPGLPCRRTPRRAYSPRPSPPPGPEPPTRHQYEDFDFREFARTGRLDDAMEDIWSNTPGTPSRAPSRVSSRVSSASNDPTSSSSSSAANDAANDATSSSSSSAANDPCTIV